MQSFFSVGNVTTLKKNLYSIPASRFFVEGLHKQRAKDLSFLIRKILHESSALQPACLHTESRICPSRCVDLYSIILMPGFRSPSPDNKSLSNSLF